MKKQFKLFGIAILMIFGITGTSFGFISFDHSSCNDYIFAITPVGNGIYGLHGYEYGCGADNRQSDGTLVVAGAYAYAGYNTQLPGFDFNNLGTHTEVITLSTDTGTYIYMYMYLSGGVMSGHGGTGTTVLNRNATPTRVLLDGLDQSMN